jgi:ABC-type oligopeptide transport system substrate-binding subunit
MKTIAIAFLLSTSLLVGCNNNSSTKNADGTHTHADGSTHDDHAKTDTTKQEEFSVASDSTATTEKEHTHKDGKPHTHGDDHKHE